MGYNNQEDDALELAEEILAKFQENGSKKGEAAALDALAKYHEMKGDKEKALEMATKALEGIRELGDRKWESIMLSRVALMQLEANNCGEAGEMNRQATDIFR